VISYAENWWPTAFLRRPQMVIDATPPICPHIVIGHSPPILFPFAREEGYCNQSEFDNPAGRPHTAIWQHPEGHLLGPTRGTHRRQRYDTLTTPGARSVAETTDPSTGCGLKHQKVQDRDRPVRSHTKKSARYHRSSTLLGKSFRLPYTQVVQVPMIHWNPRFFQPQRVECGCIIFPVITVEKGYAWSETSIGSIRNLLLSWFPG